MIIGIEKSLRKVNCATSPYTYNQSQTEIGHTLKTLKGSRIGRSKYGVGKSIGGSIYVYKDYADLIVPDEILNNAEDVAEEIGFQYNCIRYDVKTQSVSFQECPDFDTAREPMVGDYLTVNKDGSYKMGHSNYIFHHKWLWVKNDYNGFDVGESWEWSRKWLSILQEPSDGNGINRWNAQLRRYDLPLDQKQF